MIHINIKLFANSYATPPGSKIDFHHLFYQYVTPLGSGDSIIEEVDSITLRQKWLLYKEGIALILQYYRTSQTPPKAVSAQK